MDGRRKRPHAMKYLIFALASSLCLAQSGKIKFDPSKLTNPEPRWPKIISPLTVDSQWVKTETVDSAQVIIEGFRVQVLATGDRGKAENLKNDLSLKYTHNIYVVFEAPNYKVRMGNFIDRKHAESFRQSLVNSGYPSAWIIRTRIDPDLK